MNRNSLQWIAINCIMNEIKLFEHDCLLLQRGGNSVWRTQVELYSGDFGKTYDD